MSPTPTTPTEPPTPVAVTEPLVLRTAAADLRLTTTYTPVNGEEPPSGRGRGLNSRRKPADQSELLLTTGAPYRDRQSALTYSRTNVRMLESERVELTDNPLYWDTSRLLEFIRLTDCAPYVDILSQNVSILYYNGDILTLFIINITFLYSTPYLVAEVTDSLHIKYKILPL